MNLKNLSTVRPVAGPLLLFLAFGMVNILGVKPFQALDEPRHAAYAVVLATGRIPNIRELIPYEVLHTGRIRGTNAMVAAVHPPLYYSVVALPLKLGRLLGQMDWGVRMARFLTLLMGAAGSSMFSYWYVSCCPRSLQRQR
jgi:hypothetical protein